MKNSFYFDHDYSSRNDQKILKLRSRYGMEGYGIFWCLMETMAEDSTGYIDGSAIDVLSMSYCVPIDRLKEIIDYMNDIQLIEKCEHGNYFNKRMLEHKSFRVERSESGKRGAYNRWKKQEVNSSANGSPNAKEIKDSKEDKGKKKERREYPPLIIECSELLKKRILERKQIKLTDPQFEGWNNECRLMVERDGRTPEDIKKMINECHDMPVSPSGFTWANNILSMGTLREKWNQGKIFLGMNKLSKESSVRPRKILNNAFERTEPDGFADTAE